MGQILVGPLDEPVSCGSILIDLHLEKQRTKNELESLVWLVNYGDSRSRRAGVWYLVSKKGC